ncbi:hypothetical protein D3C71_760210 [compost metagenome]
MCKTSLFTLPILPMLTLFYDSNPHHVCSIHKKKGYMRTLAHVTQLYAPHACPIPLKQVEGRPHFPFKLLRCYGFRQWLQHDQNGRIQHFRRPEPLHQPLRRAAQSGR